MDIVRFASSFGGEGGMILKLCERNVLSTQEQVNVLNKNGRNTTTFIYRILHIVQVICSLTNTFSVQDLNIYDLNANILIASMLVPNSYLSQLVMLLILT